MIIYNVNNAIEPLKKFAKTLPAFTKNQKYIKVLTSFDIETSSFYDTDNQKTAIMYNWQYALYNGTTSIIIMGRTHQEYYTLNKMLYDIFNLKKHILITFVHNLSYEFQFIRSRFDWSNIFAMEPRKVLYAVNSFNIEYRCSYLLTGLPLSKLANNIKKHQIQKLTGDIDHTKIHTPATPLTQQELNYCINDVLIIVYYIHEELYNSGYTLETLPHTKTSYVRDYCRKSIRSYRGQPTTSKQSKKQAKEYRELISKLTIEPAEYSLLKQSFQGGFTHANPKYSGYTLNNVDSIDFTSSYPSVMIAERFPMGKGQRVQVKDLEHFNKLISCYCCIFYLKLSNVKATFNNDHYITSYKCIELTNPTIDNGRIVSADTLTIPITNVDYDIIKRTYSYDHMAVSNMYIYKRDYLPTPLVYAILQLYQNKTVLKNVQGKEYEYQVSKGMLNSVYGMTVTDINKDIITYFNEEWHEEPANLADNLDKYNTSKKRFLFYPWGVFVTAYARANLWTGILNINNDYIYADTDSIKLLNYDQHTEYINSYNEYTLYKLRQACFYHNLPIELIEPKTINNITKPLGVWDLETTNNPYQQFKTLGAKRYIYNDHTGLHITIAGVNKSAGAKYLNTFKEPFTQFKDGLYFPATHSGKLTHTYIDTPRRGAVYDYQHTPYQYNELTSVHLEQSDYCISLSLLYLDYLTAINERNIIHV